MCPNLWDYSVQPTLHSQPITDLHDESVLGRGTPERLKVLTEVEVTVDGVPPLLTLPNEQNR